MIRLIDTITYDNVKYDVVENDKISLSEHCDYCEFKDKCESFLIDKEWLACDAVFSSNKIYLVKHN